MSDPVLARVEAIVSGIAGSGRAVPSPGPQTPLGAQGYWLDSVDVLEVILACEHEFGVQLADAGDLTGETLASLGTLTDLVRRKLP
jgi:acyl carrier protein